VIYQGSPLPAFTSTYTGFKNNDFTTIVAGPVYKLTPAFTGAAGVYTITPSGLQLLKPANYAITYTDGTLYVNPKGSGARKLKPRLECVEVLNNHASGFKYIAHFSYENPNPTPLFVPRGTDNSLDAFGQYSGQQPELFDPGVGYFDIYFDGMKLIWTVRTYETNQKSSVATEASSTSSKCPAGFVSSSSGIQGMAAVNQDGSLIEQQSATLNVSIYPNPVTNVLTITAGNLAVTEKDIDVFDIQGRQQRVKTIGNSSYNKILFDVSMLYRGAYIVRIKTGKGYTMKRIVKK
jgi:hypothetical protein